MSEDAKLRLAYDELLAARRPADRARCPPPDALLRLVGREGDEAARLATLDHVLRCGWCRPELDLLRASADAAAVVARGRPGAAGRVFGMPVRALAMAAGIVVVAGVGLIARGRDRPDSGQLRGGVPAVTLATPERRADGGVELRWSRPSDAVRYRVEVLAASGATVAQALVTDTTYVVSRASMAGAPAPLQWMVTAIRADGAEHSSPMGRIGP